MEINRTKLILSLIFFLLPGVMLSEEYRGYNLPFYDKGIGGTPSGLGGAFVSIADDGNAPFYNPAGLPDIQKKIISLNYRSSFIGSENLIYISYLYNPNQKSGLGFSFIWSSIGDLQIYDEAQQIKGSYNVSHILVGISYGRALTKGINIGLTVKYFTHNVYSYSGNNLDSDFGALFKLLPTLRFGLTVQNFIPMGYKLRETDEDIPLTIKSGLSFLLFKGRVMLAYDIEKTMLSSFEDTAFVHHIGMQFTPLKYINLNLGYDLRNFYLGINLKLETFSFYSGTIRNKDAGNLNFGASYTFAEYKAGKGGVDAEMETFYEGIVAYQNKDYRTAIKHFQNVLGKRYDPTAEYYLNNSKAFLESEEWMSEEEKVIVGMKLELAKKYVNQQEYGKAISALRDVVKVNPANEEANELLVKTKNMVQKDVEKIYEEARALFDKEQNKESLNKCNMALSLNPEHDPSQELKKENEKILKVEYDSEYQEKQAKDEAEAMYNAGLESFKNENWIDAIDKFKRSYELVKDDETKKYLDSARKQLQESKSTEKNKKESDVHLKLGIKLFEQNKIKESVEEFEKAINLYPRNEEAQKYLNESRAKYDDLIRVPLEKGKLALRENKIADAIGNFEKVLVIDPDNEIAKQFLKKSRALITDSIELNLKLGKKEFDQNNYSKALEHYREVLKLDKDNKEGKEGADRSFAKLQTEIKVVFNKGVEAYNNKKYKTAVEEFENVLKLDKEYSPAIDWLEKARSKYEDNKVTLTIDEYLQSGKEYFQNKNYKQAMVFFNKVLELDGKNKQASSYIEMCNREIAQLGKQEEIAKIITDGLIHFRRKKFNEAIEVWQKAKTIDPQNQIIDDYIKFAQKAKEESLNKFYNDGVTFFNEGNLLKAKENLEKALQTNPNHTIARQKLAEVKSAIFEISSKAKKDGKGNFNNGDYDKALESFEIVLKYESENEEISDYQEMTIKIQDLLKDGRAHLDKDDYIEAIESFNNVLEYNKNDAKAKELVRQALLKGKKQASKWFNDGLDYYKKGELKKAQSRFSSVLKADPNHEEANKQLSEVEKEIDNKVRSYYKTGLAYYEQKNYKDSITEFNKIQDLKGNYRDSRILLAKASKIYDQQTSNQRQVSQQKVQEFLFSGIKLYRDGKLKEAISEWQKVLKVYPNHSKAIKYINRAKYKLSQLEKLK
ncbi:MAG: PorV/PorQ family protein [Spirochaetes bacterium]|nr:PorV/PorQ family protein [Spirochaetota bacterium]